MTSSTVDRRDDILIAAFFPAVGLLLFLLQWISGEPPIPDAALGHFTWLEWSLLTPLITAFVRRTQHLGAARRLAAHAFGTIVSASVHLALYLLAVALVASPALEILVEIAQRRSPRHLMFALVNYMTIVAALQFLAHWRRSEAEEEFRSGLQERLADVRLRQFRDRVDVPEVARAIDGIIESIRTGSGRARTEVIGLAGDLRVRLRSIEASLPENGESQIVEFATPRQRLIGAVLVYPLFGLIANTLFLVARVQPPGSLGSFAAAMTGWLVAGIAIIPLVLFVERLSASAATRSTQLLIGAAGALAHALLTDRIAIAGVIHHSSASPESIITVGTTLKVLLTTAVLYAIETARTLDRLRQRRAESARLKSLIRETNLQMLRAQFRPHFIFNVLNSVVSLIRHDPEKAIAMLEGLKDLLDLSIAGDEEVFVTLGAEIESTRKYLQLEQIRLGDRLRLVIDTTPEAADSLVPQFILQPLVENAVRHGVARRAKGGEIAIHACVCGESLHLEVTNSGVWIQNGSHGLGLSNTRRRLAHIFKSDHDFDIDHDADQVRVSLRIPRSFVPAEVSA